MSYLNNNLLLVTGIVSGIIILSLYGEAEESPRLRRFFRYFFAFIFGGPRNLRRKKILDAIRFPLRGKDSKDSGLPTYELFKYFCKYLTEDEFDYLLRKNNYINNNERNSFDPSRWKVPRPSVEMLMEPMAPYLRELRKEHLKRLLGDTYKLGRFLEKKNSPRYEKGELRFTQKRYIKLREKLQEQFNVRSSTTFLVAYLAFFLSALLLFLFFASEYKIITSALLIVLNTLFFHLYLRAARKRRKIFYRHVKMVAREF